MLGLAMLADRVGNLGTQLGYLAARLDHIEQQSWVTVDVLDMKLVGLARHFEAVTTASVREDGDLDFVGHVEPSGGSRRLLRERVQLPHADGPPSRLAVARRLQRERVLLPRAAGSRSVWQ